MSNIQIESDLKEVLGEINSKLGKIDARLNNIEISQARLEEKFDAQEKIVTELKGSQLGADLGINCFSFYGGCQFGHWIG